MTSLSIEPAAETEDEEVPPTSESAPPDFAFSGVVLAIAGTFLFAMKSIFIKFAFADGANATLLLMLRLLFSVPFYCAMLFYLRRQNSDRVRPTARQILISVVLGFLGYYLASFLDMAGLERISAQLERLTLFTYPAIVSLLAWMLLGEQLNGRIIASIAFCYAGLGVMYSQERTMPNTQNVGLGVLLVMGAAISYSVYILFAKPLMQKIGSREFTCYAMIGSTVFMCIHFFATQGFKQLVSAPSSVYAYGITLAFVCTVIPSFLVNEAVVRLGAARTSVIGSIGPVITMGLAIVLLGESSSVYHFAGMLIVIFGVSLIARKSN